MKCSSKAMVSVMIAAMAWESRAEAISKDRNAMLKRAGGAEMIDKGKNVVEEVWSARPSEAESEIVLDFDGLRLDHPGSSYGQARQSTTTPTSPSVSTLPPLFFALSWLLPRRLTSFAIFLDSVVERNVQGSLEGSSDDEWSSTKHPRELSLSSPLEFPIKEGVSQFDVWVAISPRRLVMSPPRPRVEPDDAALLPLPFEQQSTENPRDSRQLSVTTPAAVEPKRKKGKGKMMSFGKSFFKRLSLSSSSSSGSASSYRASSARASSSVGDNGSDATPDSDPRGGGGGAGKDTRLEGG
ncbi:uncharacterized protein SPSC_04203 [Sporisorium scitamineum]|uniref:Uncharacterized protein n=1 Tax=Sporisorium scitamineum TaxID=49012 RepID=A0A127Z3L6_9BASI|nr:uncharacterized protein SPSC_04203 [Sporisorium scitamineum]